MRLLVLHPAPAADPCMDAILHGAVVLDVKLILPIIVLGIDVVFANKWCDLRWL